MVGTTTTDEPLLAYLELQVPAGDEPKLAGCLQG